MTIKYSLCVPTFKRPHSLDRLMMSISQQKWSPEHNNLEIIIADNDANESARIIVEKWANTLLFSVKYLCVKQRGLAHVRNALLDAATHEHVILLDDDQLVQDKFFMSLDKEWQERPKDVVAAAFRFDPLFDENFTPYLKEMTIISYPKRNKERFHEMAYCGTNGAIFLLSAIRGANIRFDMRCNEIGGEDNQFFSEVAQIGKIVQLSNVEIFEYYSAERGRLSYILFSAFQRGTVYIKIHVMNKKYFTVFKIILDALLKALAGTILLPLLIFAPAAYRAYFMVLYLRQIGKLVGLTGISFKFYISFGIKRTTQS